MNTCRSMGERMGYAGVVENCLATGPIFFRKFQNAGRWGLLFLFSLTKNVVHWRKFCMSGTVLEIIKSGNFYFHQNMIIENQSNKLWIMKEEIVYDIFCTSEYYFPILLKINCCVVENIIVVSEWWSMSSWLWHSSGFVVFILCLLPRILDR